MANLNENMRFVGGPKDKEYQRKVLGNKFNALEKARTKKKQGLIEKSNNRDNDKQQVNANREKRRSLLP